MTTTSTEASDQAVAAMTVMIAQMGVVKAMLSGEGWTQNEIATLLHALIVEEMA
jgi:hypothetical protein